MTDLVTCQCESCENMKEFFVTSPHIMPCPIVSQITNANHKMEHDSREMFMSLQNTMTCQDTSHETYFNAC